MIDKQPWVEIDFRKPALIKAIKLLRLVFKKLSSGTRYCKKLKKYENLG